MSTIGTILLIVVALLALLVVVPRLLMAIQTRRLKGKPAPTPHKASAGRIRSGKKTILYFFTPPCGACKMQDPIVSRVKKLHPKAIYKIDASENREAASAYGVMGVPFLAFIENGTLVAAKSGVQQEAALVDFLNS